MAENIKILYLKMKMFHYSQWGYSQRFWVSFLCLEHLKFYLDTVDQLPGHFIQLQLSKRDILRLLIKLGHDSSNVLFTFTRQKSRSPVLKRIYCQQQLLGAPCSRHLTSNAKGLNLKISNIGDGIDLLHFNKSWKLS